MQNDKAAVLEVAIAIRDVIAAAGSRGIPSGHLYAQLMGKMSLSTYQQIEDFLVGSGLIKRDNFLLTAVHTNLP